MDPWQFDRLVQALARPGTRRHALGVLLASVIAPSGAAASPAPAACLAIGKRCAPHEAGPNQRARHETGKRSGKSKSAHHSPSCAKCCSRFGAPSADGKPRCACKAEGDPCANPSQCCGGLCRDGTCTGCPGDLIACDGNCVDRQTNDDHCGACATACAAGQRCVAGACVCDGTSCPRGCCDEQGACQRGTSDQACGIGGADCQTCQTCATCDGTTCAAQSDVCCGATKVCANGVCTKCADGQRCQGGSCLCDATSCPNGCCAGDQCVPFARQSTDACGMGGAACQACAGYDTCGGGGTNGVCGCTPATTCPGGQTCGAAQDGCGGAIACSGCAGCCDGDACNAGTSDGSCGKNGAGCVSCPSPQICHDQSCCTPDPGATTCNGQCGKVRNNCGQEVDCTALCAGCCDGATCRGGTDDNMCGANGNSCVRCQGFDTCGGSGAAGVCGCAPVSDAKTCAGQCGMVRNNCGQDIDCTRLCAGCCSGTVCHDGSTDAFCGRNGAACAACDLTDPVCGGHCSSFSHACAYAGSHTSCGHDRCVDGVLTLAGACDGNGGCAPGNSVSCGSYLCNATGTACLTTCESDDDCVAGDYCTAGRTCEGAQSNGASCDHGRQCQSGNCVNGACCASAACGPCETCATSTGVCATTCGSARYCCLGVCKTQTGNHCDQDSDCCHDRSELCAPGYQVCCSLRFDCGGPDGLCCSAFNIG